MNIISFYLSLIGLNFIADIKNDPNAFKSNPSIIQSMSTSLPVEEQGMSLEIWSITGTINPKTIFPFTINSLDEITNKLKIRKLDTCKETQFVKKDIETIRKIKTRKIGNHYMVNYVLIFGLMLFLTFIFMTLHKMNAFNEILKIDSKRYHVLTEVEV